ncbi:putative DNA double-strand break repair Rad50 ATPase [Danaus plexippus plexippus]|uniref:separase n=1 Tax=Danaus plexippus plexippus TaxID=278856 RepID=A0A212F215_DANPL|nr:putative DNA double-strand break repair Rad50 ATPase [Danaus plexippus plexippus]
MEDFDIFTNEIDFAKPVHKNILNNYVNNVPKTPSGPNYESGRKLLGQECLADGLENECAFHFSESASPTLRTLAVYRDEQLKTADNRLNKITDYIKPIKNIVDQNPITKEDDAVLDLFINDVDNVTKILDKYNMEEEMPFYKQYMRFSSDNNVDNFMKILKELPKEWTIIQLTAPYNANENLKPFTDYRTEIKSLYITLLGNKYFDSPLTIEVPANVTKEGEKPLFEELYSLLEENYRTIDNAQFLNNKRLVQNYWSKREDIDLRMKSIINVMYKEWLGGFASLLTGRLLDDQLRDRVVSLVDTAINDWGFIRLTEKQKMLLYNLIESSALLSSQQIKSCLRKILTEHGNIDDIRRTLKTDCVNCSAEFRLASELCLKCLSQCFEVIHHFTLVDGIKAFSQVATQVKDGDEWASLKKAKRQPVILIVDELLDTFPWETLPTLNQHPVTRMENIHFLYALYKMHENKIINGYYTASSRVGRYVINPEKNLDRMEHRMRSFVNYWCKSWTGHAGETPSADQYLKCLTEADVFLYCGHGDGLQLASTSSHIEGASCGGVCVLSGCGSLRLVREGGRAPPTAAHHHLHVAGCPMVIGMLWEVTDLEVDKMVTTMLSLFVPSEAPCDWKCIGKSKWSQGTIDIPSPPSPPQSRCSDVLLAASKSRLATGFMMISSSLVVRGIPVVIN